MIYFNRDRTEVIEELMSDEKDGLSDLDVKAAQEKYGPNEFSKSKTSSSWDDLSDPLIIILLIAAAISFLIGEYIDAIGIILAITLGSVIGYLTEEKSKQAAEELSKITENIFIKCIRNGEVNLVLKNDLVPGDIVLLETGNIVPADGRILESMGLKAREDMLTGESDDVDKHADIIIDMEKIEVKGNTIIQEPVPAKQINMLFGGTLIASGRGKMIVTAIGDSTQMGKIAQSINEVDNETPLQIKLGDLGKNIAKLSGSIALILFIFMILKMLIQKLIIIDSSGIIPFLNSIKPVKNAFVVCVALVVAAVPEGLPTMINMTLAITMQKMAKINALITKKESCETIGSISVICSDKTGTLTQNRMTVEKVFVNGDYKEKYDSNESYFIDNCIINSTADIKYINREWQYMGSATECALLVYLEDKQYFEYRKSKDITYQIPFTSKTKRMDTVIREGEDYVLLSKGAPEVILDSCEYEYLNGQIVKLTKDRKQYIVEQIKKLQDQAMRALGFAYKKISKSNINTFNNTNVDLYERNLIFTGFVGIRDPLRPDVKDAISIAEKAGVKTKMLTGDNINTAVAIGYELGLLENNNRAVESTFIDALSDQELREEIKTISIVARSKPETKMRIVEALQDNGEVVAVTGDGINDVPALVKADVGIAMGIAGTEVTKKSASIILTDDSFSTIVRGIQWGRGIYENFQRFIQFQLTVNIVAFLIAIISQIIGRDMPFTTIQLLWINIIMDGPPALSLGLEPVREDLLNRKPIKKNSNIISETMLKSIIVNSTFITLILFIQMFWNPLGVSTSNYSQAGIYVGNEMQTSLFALLAFSALFNALNCREFGLNSIIPNFGKNNLALITLLATGCAQIIFMTYYNYFFNTVPLRFAVWVKIIIMASAVVWANEILKYFLRSIRSKTTY
ncbi:calcium-translocating P-type ATPase, PMCA-type [Tissierella carlieri]|uniref:calcium-translocating P-type ATPase, PMCA-type n=1 Tax=Tissierella carlieri TaxID=689904 RepID=UPI001C113F06|nr:calcium-translocating P-type ATPase, PMCA-type [Tissierella carlieri]MBU5311965.1 calcium-translocating P-type ATPase, PMCA-type [Tissierella carlieri]